MDNSLEHQEERPQLVSSAVLYGYSNIRKKAATPPSILKNMEDNKQPNFTNSYYHDKIENAKDYYRNQEANSNAYYFPTQADEDKL